MHTVVLPRSLVAERPGLARTVYDGYLAAKNAGMNLAANRTTIDTFLRYHFEQGLSARHLTCEELFAPEPNPSGADPVPE